MHSALTNDNHLNPNQNPFVTLTLIMTLTIDNVFCFINNF